MDAKSIGNSQESGLLVAGWVIFSSATFHERTNGKGAFVLIEEEIAARPWHVTLIRFLEPQDERIKLDGDKVLEYPGLVALSRVLLQVMEFNLKPETIQVRKAKVFKDGNWSEL